MSFAVLLLAVSALYLYLLSLPTFLIGDGREYACGSALWLTDFTPWHSEAAVRACIQEILPGDPHGVHGWERTGDSIESVHFVGHPFSSTVCRNRPAYGSGYPDRLDLVSLGADLVRTWWTRRRVGATAAACLLLALAASPFVYWTTKAHSEIFVCLMLALAFVEAWWPGNLLWLRCSAPWPRHNRLLSVVTALPCLAAWAVFRRSLPAQPPDCWWRRSRRLPSPRCLHASSRAAGAAELGT